MGHPRAVTPISPSAAIPSGILSAGRSGSSLLGSRGPPPGHPQGPRGPIPPTPQIIPGQSVRMNLQPRPQDPQMMQRMQMQGAQSGGARQNVIIGSNQSQQSSLRTAASGKQPIPGQPLLATNGPSGAAPLRSSMTGGSLLGDRFGPIPRPPMGQGSSMNSSLQGPSFGSNRPYDNSSSGAQSGWVMDPRGGGPKMVGGAVSPGSTAQRGQFGTMSGGNTYNNGMLRPLSGVSSNHAGAKQQMLGKGQQLQQHQSQQQQKLQQQQQQEEEEEVKPLLAPTLTRAPDGTVLPKRYLSSLETHLRTDRTISLLLLEAGATVTTTAPASSAAIEPASPVPTTPLVAQSPSAITPKAEGSATPSAAPAATVVTFAGQLPISLTKERVMNAINSLDAGLKAFVETTEKVEKDLPQLKQAAAALRAKRTLQLEKKAAAEQAVKERLLALAAAAAAAAAVKAADDERGSSMQAASAASAVAAAAAAEASVESGEVVFPLFPLFTGADSVNVSPETLSNQIFVSLAGASTVMHILRLAASWTPNAAWFSQNTYSDSVKTELYTSGLSDIADTLLLSGGINLENELSSNRGPEVSSGDIVMDGTSHTQSITTQSTDCVPVSTKNSSDLYGFGGLQLTVASLLPLSPSPPPAASSALLSLTSPSRAQLPSSVVDSDDIVNTQKKGADKTAVDKKESETVYERSLSLQRFLKRTSVEKLVSFLSSSLSRIQKNEEDARFILFDDCNGAEIPVAEKDLLVASSASAAFNSSSSSNLVMAASKNVSCVIRLHSTLPFNLLAPSDDSISSISSTEALVEAALKGKMMLRLSAELPRVAVFAFKPTGFSNQNSVVFATVTASMDDMAKVSSAFVTPPQHSMMRFVSKRKAASALTASATDPALTSSTPPLGVLLPLSPLLEHAAAWEAAEESRATVMLENRGKSVFSHMPMLILARKAAQQSQSALINSNNKDSVTLCVPSKLRSKAIFSKNTLVTKRLVSSIDDADFNENASKDRMELDETSADTSGNSNALLELEEKVRATLLEASTTGDNALDISVLAPLSALVIDASGSVDTLAIKEAMKRQEQNARRHAAIRSRMTKTLLIRRSILRSQSVALGAEYVRSYAAWTSRCREQGRLRKLRSLEAAARKRAGIGLDIDIIPQDSPRDTGRHRRGGIEGEGSSSSRSAAAERDALVAVDTDLPSDSEGEDNSFGEGGGDVVRSEWEMQQKLEQLGRRERLATMRLYQTAVLPDLLPHAQNDPARTLKSFGVGQSGRLTTDGAPMLCSHLPPRVSCSSLLQPSPQQIVLTSPDEIIQATSHSRLSGEAAIPSLLGRRNRPQLLDTRLDFDDNELSGGIETTHSPLWFGGCNCPVAVEITSRNTNPWSDTEKLIFCDRFMQTPKDFGSIAAGLPNKTPGDCIAFYYLTKNVAGYKWRIKAQANGLKRKLHTTIGWVQACGAARDIGVPIHADVVRGGVLKESSGAKKVVVASVRVGDLSYSRTFLHPGPYARVTALHRIVSAPIPLSTVPPSTAPVVQVAALSQVALAGSKLAASGGGGGGHNTSVPSTLTAINLATTPKRSNTFSSESGMLSPSSASGQNDALGVSEKVILASAASSASSMLGFTKSRLAQAGITSPSASQLVVPKDARNEFIYMYGTGATSLPWSYKFSDRVNGEDDPDPLVGQIPTAAQLLAGAGSGIGGSLVRVYENADKMFRTSTSGKKERHGVNSSSYSDSKAGKEPSLEQHNDRLVNLLTKAWASGSRSSLRKAASELASSGFVSASQAHDRLVGRLVPPSTQPQYSSSFGTAGQGAGAGSLARFPLSPQTTQQAADFIVYTLFPVLCSLAGAIQPQPSKQSSMLKQLLLPLSSLDDDRYIGFMWRLLALSSARRSFHVSMRELAQSLSELQVGNSSSRSSPHLSALATLFPFVDKMHLSTLKFNSSINAATEQDEDDGQKRSKLIKVDLTGKPEADSSRLASGTSYTLPVVAEAEPVAASKLSIDITPSTLDLLPSRVQEILAKQIPSIRSLVLFLINSSYSASAELAATTAALSAKSAAEAAAAAAKEAADAAEASLQVQSPNSSTGAEKEKKKSSTKKVSSSSPEGIAEAALTQLSLPSHGPVALLSTGTYFQPNGPVSTLRYFDPMSSPNVYQGFGDIEGIWPHTDLVNESLACDRASVLSARRARLLYRRAGQRTRPPPHLRIDTDLIRGRSAAFNPDDRENGIVDDDLDLLSRKEIDEILSEPKAVGIARRAAAAAASASAIANTVEVDEPVSQLLDIDYGTDVCASILDGSFESRLPVLPTAPSEPIDLNNPETLAKWSEHDKLVLSWALGQHGRDWSAISDVIGTKSATQVNSYFAKYHSTRELDDILAVREREMSLREAALLSQRTQGAQAPSEFEETIPVPYEEQAQALQVDGDVVVEGEVEMQSGLENAEANDEYTSYEGQDGAADYSHQQQGDGERQDVYEDANARDYYDAQGRQEVIDSSNGPADGSHHVSQLADGGDEQVATTYFEDISGAGGAGGGEEEVVSGDYEAVGEGQMDEDGTAGEGGWQQQDVIVDSDGVPVHGLANTGDGSVMFEQYRDQHQQWGEEEQQADYQADDDFGGATLETTEMDVDEEGSGDEETSASELES